MFLLNSVERNFLTNKKRDEEEIRCDEGNSLLGVIYVVVTFFTPSGGTIPTLARLLLHYCQTKWQDAAFLGYVMILIKKKNLLDIFLLII